MTAPAQLADAGVPPHMIHKVGSGTCATPAPATTSDLIKVRVTQKVVIAASRRKAMNVVDIRSDLRMVLDSGPGQAYLLRRGTQAVLIDTGIATPIVRPGRLN